MNYTIRITILKKLFHEEIIQEYADAPEEWTTCPSFNTGDVFIVDSTSPWDKPSGFCGWAWADIQKMIWGMSRGGPKKFVTSCTDGYRPVIFLLEQLQSPPYHSK